MVPHLQGTCIHLRDEEINHHSFLAPKCTDSLLWGELTWPLMSTYGGKRCSLYRRGWRILNQNVYEATLSTDNHRHMMRQE